MMTCVMSDVATKHLVEEELLFAFIFCVLKQTISSCCSDFILGVQRETMSLWFAERDGFFLMCRLLVLRKKRLVFGVQKETVSFWCADFWCPERNDSSLVCRKRRRRHGIQIELSDSSLLQAVRSRFCPKSSRLCKRQIQDWRLAISTLLQQKLRKRH